MIMADCWINCFSLSRLPDINVPLTFITCTDRHGIVELTNLSFKSFELEFGLKAPDVSVIYLALVFDIFDILQIHLNQLNSLTHWFAHGDYAISCLVQA